MDDEEPIDEEPIDETTIKTEGGVAVTGTSVEELEERVTKKLRGTFSNSFRNVYGILALLFFFLVALGVVVHNLNDSVDNVTVIAKHSDTILANATGPEAQKKNDEILKDLINKMDCSTQRNLQKFATILVANGSVKFESIQPILEARCK